MIAQGHFVGCGFGKVVDVESHPMGLNGFEFMEVHTCGGYGSVDASGDGFAVALKNKWIGAF